MTSKSFEFIEDNLKFNFVGIKDAEKFDEEGKKLPQGIVPVDFVVEDRDCFWLIEVKCGKDGFASDKLDEASINNVFVPKARDTYTCLHLMERDNKPFKYIVVLDDVDFHHSDFPKLERMQGRLCERLACELDVPWKRQYITKAFIVGASKAASYFPFCQVERV
jgi:hypothetical protein